MKYFFVVTFVAIGSLLSSPLLVHTAEESNRGSWLRDSWAQTSDTRQKIAELPSTPVAAISIPILFGIELNDISPNFGDARSGGRSHEGEDIMATRGTPIVSPTEAVVLRTGEGPSEGLYVYTANPGGETFVYMHLDRIGEGVDKGDVLEKGDLIGYVGNTGNASATLPHLHFEIHNANGNPTDPYPRITAEFTLAEKMTYTERMLNISTDRETLARFLTDTFRSTFVSAKASGITLPASITAILGSLSLPHTTLAQGSTGADVRLLQNYLIESNIGSAARSLATTGATGYFGALTRAALVEYQNSIGIPITGVYDATTRSSASNSPVATPGPTSSPAPTAVISGVQFTRDLARNMSSVDVRTLQQILNARGFIIATSGAGSPGNETLYFGAATEAAVKKFQTAQGISPISGYVGPLTRTALNSFIN